PPPRKTQNMQHLFALLVLLHMQVCLLLKDCKWKVVLNDFDNLGGDQAVFFRQHPVTSVASVFQNLTDSAIDLTDKNSHYLGFPYYLKITLPCSCESVQASWGYLFVSRAPTGPCASEEVCRMCWYTPMPMTKRSVVMEVLVKSNGLGLEVDNKRFVMNINGYMKETETGLQSSLGEKVNCSKGRSRPIWSTFNQAPVLILGGFQGYKVILVSDSEFADFTAVEVKRAGNGGLGPFRRQPQWQASASYRSIPFPLT
uniref:Cation channel sperm associated auxiliary subunit gamma n=1 Tax=Chelonoidis abingdonii TaxID=106734 RepID=A0A8C0G7T3_CHEAB